MTGVSLIDAAGRVLADPDVDAAKLARLNFLMLTALAQVEDEAGLRMVGDALVDAIITCPPDGPPATAARPNLVVVEPVRGRHCRHRHRGGRHVWWEACRWLDKPRVTVVVAVLAVVPLIVVLL